MTIIVNLAASAATFAFATLCRPQRASAHCDTMDGPVVRDGSLALDTGNPHHFVKWISPAGEPELSAVFEQSLAARALGGAAREVADRWFLENLVRIHRAGEGVGYTGVKPTGTPVDAKVAAADRSIAEGSLDALAGMVPAELHEELERRFAAVLERRDYDVDDVDAGRAYIEAYVSFFKFAEGKGHDHPHLHAAH